MEYFIKSINGEINRATLDEESVLHINLKKESILNVNINSIADQKSIKQIRLSDIIKNYKGPSVFFDINNNNNNELIGFEILSD